jgi:ABC-type cobalamin/Fe3+-siderophores transport system ATPase subunit
MPDREPPVAELRGVVAGYPGRRVLDGADLTVGRGELVALLGPNGSGKTTLLRVLAGTLAPDAGVATLFGVPVGAWSRRDLARRVAVLPQSLELPAGLRVAEVVALGRIPHGDRLFALGQGDEAVVSDALRDAGATDLADRPASELSGGERQRVLVAMALAQEPELLLLDEPTLHLDLGHQLALVRLLDVLRAARSLTVVAVLHDLNLATALADRLMLLRGGSLTEIGSHGGRLNVGAVRDAFGVGIDEALTADGRPVLVPAVHPVRAPFGD